jgi:CHAD domain-containing protein
MLDEEPREDAPLATHLRELVDKRLARLTECRHFATKSDPAEALHDLRVASRRLRAFGEVFRGSIGRKTHWRSDALLKRITRAAGSVRDCDVRIGLVEAELPDCATDAERATLEYLLEHFDEDRTRALAKAEKRLGKIDFDALTAGVRAGRSEALLRLPGSRQKARAFAGQLLEHFVSDAERRAPPEDGTERPEQMHRLRIGVKKLKYALELFEPTLGIAYESLYARASALQELLGSHHDLVLLGDFVEKCGTRLDEKRRLALSSGMKVLHDRLASERASLAARYSRETFDPEWWRTGIRRVQD